MSAGSLQKRLAALNKIPQTTTRLAAKEVEKIAREVGAQVGPVALGRKGRRVQLTAVSRFKGSGATVEATVYGRPTGPWVWVTSGTTPHTIAPRKSRGKARSTRYLKGDKYSHPIGRPVQHPGASGKGAWRRVVKRANDKVPEVYLDAVRKVIA